MESSNTWTFAFLIKLKVFPNKTSKQQSYDVIGQIQRFPLSFKIIFLILIDCKCDLENIMHI